MTSYKNDNTNLYNFFYYRKIYNYRPGAFPSVRIPKLRIIKPYGIYDELFKKSTITNCDFRNILENYKNNEKALIYIDPPYFNSSNSLYGDNYSPKNSNNIDNTDMYIDIIDFMDNSKCYFIMIINENSIMKYIFKKYLYKSYDKTYYKGRKVRHMIITNIHINKIIN